MNERIARQVRMGRRARGPVPVDMDYTESPSRAPVRKWSIGSKVHAQYMGAGNWYPATIASYTQTGYTVQWVDGGDSDVHKTDQQIKVPDRRWSIGENVHAQYANGIFYPATIASYTQTGYTIKWPDGSTADVHKTDRQIGGRL